MTDDDEDAAGGGDDACWLTRVCEECGALEDGPPHPVCARCGAPRGMTLCAVGHGTATTAELLARLQLVAVRSLVDVPALHLLPSGARPHEPAGVPAWWTAGSSGTCDQPHREVLAGVLATASTRA